MVQIERKVTAHQDCFVINGMHPFFRVMVAGDVVGVRRYTKTIVYDVDDGTGTIKCVCKLSEPGGKGDVPFKVFELADIVRVSGSLATFNG